MVAERSGFAAEQTASALLEDHGRMALFERSEV
jgi:hypothetical protein